MTDLDVLTATLNSDRFSHTSLADGTGVILDIEGEQVLTLNETSEFIVSALLGGVVDSTELISRLVSEFEVEAPQAEADVTAFLATLETQLAAH
ncbi:MAG: PqqD family protein [Holophagaceae bacterium]|nr:PqqD family protein [Holophagaceae bacterium]